MKVFIKRRIFPFGILFNRENIRNFAALNQRFGIETNLFYIVMRIRLLALLMLASAAIYAGGYRHSVGVTLGTVNGISYKGYVSNDLHFVLQVDAFWQMGLTTDWSVMTTYTVGKYNLFDRRVAISSMNGGDFQAFMVNPAFLYQGKIGRWELGNMYWFAGAGVGFGMQWGGNFDDVSIVCKPDKDFRPWLKTSQQLLMGVEFSFNAAPLVLGIELRPGMAECHISSGGNHYDSYRTASALIFDWGANFSLRYCFGEEKLVKKEK